jgi:hypothetical protein
LPVAKAIVAAVPERGGMVRARVCTAHHNPELQAFVRGNVEAGSTVNANTLKRYVGLVSQGTVRGVKVSGGRS